MQFPWSEEKSSLLTKMGIDPAEGLNEESLKSSYEKYGKNILKTGERQSRLILLFQQFKNPMSYILIMATAVAFGLGETLDAYAILIIVLINAWIGFFQESKANASIDALKKLSVPSARVIREGSIRKISAEDVVPGDILRLEAGDYIVADARVLETHQLAADESVLTGESLPVDKISSAIPSETVLPERKNMVHAATAISSGSGKAMVTQTGMNTEIGRIASMLDSGRQSMTPLQHRLEKVSRLLLYMGLATILIVILIGLGKGEDWGIILISAISLAVAAIPEGLPTVVTLSLTLAIRRMTKRKVIIRDLASVETLGSTDVICTDKTGTLTTGRMRVRDLFFLGRGITDASSPIDSDHFYRTLILCNNASLSYGESGDPTEVALLYLAQEHGKDIEGVRKRFEVKNELSFDSERKLMSVVTNDGYVYTKGAPESLLPICLNSQSEKESIIQAVQKLSSEGRRTLALAWKEQNNENDEFESKLHFLGVVGIADPPRKDTMNAIATCKDAGIKVVMITGDHPLTAKAIAKELGIIEEGIFDGVLSGIDLSSMNNEELKSKVEHTAVYARVTPEHKLRIVEALQNKGHIVAMTGDGVNDAPALKKASIGVAMGQGGTEVARQASSMVLTDDNFSAIVSAVEEGRAIFGNIRRTIQYLLSTNMAELLIMLGAILLGLPVPLTPIALLWINLVTDGFPSLALAAESVPDNYLKSSLRPSPSNFFDSSFLKELFFIGLLNTAMGLGLYYYMIQVGDLTTARSMAFTFLVYLCLFRSFSCRSEFKTFFELKFNPLHLASVIVPILIQLLIQHTEFFQDLFKVRALSLFENMILLASSLIPVTLVELEKIWRRKK